MWAGKQRWERAEEAGLPLFFLFFFPFFFCSRWGENGEKGRSEKQRRSQREMIFFISFSFSFTCYDLRGTRQGQREELTAR